MPVSLVGGDVGVLNRVLFILCECVFTCVPLHMCGGRRTTLGVSVLISTLSEAGSLHHLMLHFTSLARQKASRYSPFPASRIAPRALGLTDVCY